MRFKIACEITEGEAFSQDYRRNILRMLKTGLDRYEDIFEDFFGSNKLKKYCWSVYFKNSIFQGDKIYLQGEKKEFFINFSVFDNGDAMNIFNAFMNIKYREIDISKELRVKVSNVIKLPTKEVSGEFFRAKVMSPIICRDHNQETGKDSYYTGSEEEFIPIIKRNLYLEMREKYGDYVERDIEKLVIETKELKKTVSKFYGKLIDGSIGIIELQGKNYLLNYIYNAGLGSIRGSGYGLLEII